MSKGQQQLIHVLLCGFLRNFEHVTELYPQREFAGLRRSWTKRGLIGSSTPVCLEAWSSPCRPIHLGPPPALGGSEIVATTMWASIERATGGSLLGGLLQCGLLRCWSTMWPTTVWASSVWATTLRPATMLASATWATGAHSRIRAYAVSSAGEQSQRSLFAQVGASPMA